MPTTKKTKTTKTTRRGRKTTTVTTIVEEVVDQTKLTNHVIFLLDDSGSMAGCYTKAVEQLNKNIATVREQALKTGQRTTVSLYLFGGGGTVTCRYFQQPVSMLKELSPYEFAHGQSTPLRDAICTAIHDAQARTDAGDPDTSFLLICATDGGENSSTRYSQAHLPALVREVQGTDRWTIAMMVPHGHKSQMLSLGIPEGNVQEWENTSYGATLGFSQNNASSQNYFNSRSIGVKSVQNFYHTTDLSKLKKADLSKMDDLSGNFKALKVDKETAIKEFVESKSLKFVLGAGYYSLTKPEKLRTGRDILVREKGTNRVYGGDQARQVLGIPAGEVKVTPGNHANFDVFFQSSSINRRLVRGTELLWDKTKTKDSTETWNSAAAIAAAEAKKAAQGQSSSSS